MVFEINLSTRDCLKDGEADPESSLRMRDGVRSLKIYMIVKG
jgi:hypothetical protein